MIMFGIRRAIPQDTEAIRKPKIAAFGQSNEAILIEVKIKWVKF
jgi:hypothetical protein